MHNRTTLNVVSALLLIASAQIASAQVGGLSAKDSQSVNTGYSEKCRALGELKEFWRNAPALGPYHEIGVRLIVIPDYLLKGDFPYPKKKTKKEVPFADHLSLVRLLGGFDDFTRSAKEGMNVNAKRAKRKPIPDMHLRDLAYRKTDGKIATRWNLLRERLKPYLDNGYRDFTIVLDNVPNCFPKKPIQGDLGQVARPENPKEWHEFVKALCVELKKILGEKSANNLRFRVGTENGSHRRFIGTHDDYLKHYDASAAAVKQILPKAKFSFYNVSGVSTMANLSKHNVRVPDLVAHTIRDKNSFDGSNIPFDYLSYSRYFGVCESPTARAVGAVKVWNDFSKAFPEAADFSREVHEFGVRPWNIKGEFASKEPGAQGTAATALMLFHLRNGGASRIFNWSIAEKIPVSRSKVHYLFSGTGWLYSVMEKMRGGSGYFLLPQKESKNKTEVVALASVGKKATYIVFAAVNPDLKVSSTETYEFVLPEKCFNLEKFSSAQCVGLTRDNSLYNEIRNDLEKANSLDKKYIDAPLRCGAVRQMAISRKAARELVDKNMKKYEGIWTDALTRRKLPVKKVTVKKEGGAYNLKVRLAPPEIFVFILDNK